MENYTGDNESTPNKEKPHARANLPDENCCVLPFGRNKRQRAGAADTRPNALKPRTEHRPRTQPIALYKPVPRQKAKLGVKRVGITFGCKLAGWRNTQRRCLPGARE